MQRHAMSACKLCKGCKLSKIEWPVAGLVLFDQDATTLPKLVTADPSSTCFAFANDEQLCVQYTWQRCTSVHFQEFPTRIVDVKFLPIASKLNSSPEPYEWLALCLGLANGTISVYELSIKDQCFAHLFSLNFSHTCVKSISVETDQIVILHEDCFVTLETLSFVSTLRRYRACSKSNFSGNHLSDLVYQKWYSKNMKHWRHVCFTGVVTQTMLERMTVASAQDRPVSAMKAYSSFFDTYMTTGSDPFVSFLWNHLESDSLQSVINDTVNRIKNPLSIPYQLACYVYDTVKGSSTPACKVLPEEKSAIHVPCRSAFVDYPRAGLQLLPAPCNFELAAVSDSLGRVTLWNVRKRLCLHVWKGYRDAQLAWIQVNDGKQPPPESQSQQRCSSLLLVIFAPKRRCIDLWLASTLQLIGSLNVERPGVLLSAPPVPLQKLSALNSELPSVAFLDVSGSLYSLVVPHELCLARLSDAANETAASPSLSTWIGSVWKSRLDTEECLADALSILQTLRNACSVNRLLDVVLYSALSLDVKLVYRLLDAIGASQLLSKDDEETSRLRGRLELLAQLFNFYAVLEARDDWHPPIDAAQVHFEQLDKEALSELNDKLQEVDKTTLVDSASETRLTVVQFIAAFLVQKGGRLSLKSDSPPPDVGDFVFAPFLTSAPSWKFAEHYMSLLPLEADDWLRLFCSYWLYKSRTYAVSAEQLANLVYSLVVGGPRVDELLDLLYASVLSCEFVSEAMCLAEVAKLVAGAILSTDHEARPPPSTDWETVDERQERWSCLCKVLRGLRALRNCTAHPAHDYCSNATVRLSPKMVISSGGGFFVETFSRFLVAAHPEDAMALFDHSTPTRPWQVALAQLVLLFPLQFSANSLRLNVAYQMALRWHDRADDGSMMEAIVHCLRGISSARLRHNALCSVWLEFCRQIVKAQLFNNDHGAAGDGQDADAHILVAKNVCSMIKHCRDSLNDERVEEPLGGSVDFCEDFLEAFLSLNKAGCAAVPLFQRVSEQPLASRSNLEAHVQLTQALVLQCSSGVGGEGGGARRGQILDLFPESISSLLLTANLSQDVIDSDAYAVARRREDFVKRLAADLTDCDAFADGFVEESLLDLCLSWDIHYDLVSKERAVRLLDLDKNVDFAFHLLDTLTDRQMAAGDLFQLIERHLGNLSTNVKGQRLHVFRQSITLKRIVDFLQPLPLSANHASRLRGLRNALEAHGLYN